MVLTVSGHRAVRVHVNVATSASLRHLHCHITSTQYTSREYHFSWLEASSSSAKLLSYPGLLNWLDKYGVFPDSVE